MKLNRLLMAAIISAVSFSANAEGIRPYIGVDAGGLMISYDSSSTGISGDSVLPTDFIYAAPYVGLEFTKNWAIEVGYFQTSSESKSFNGALIGGSAATTITSEIDYSGASVDLVGKYDVNDKFDIIGVLGVVFAKADMTVSSGSLSISGTSDETAAKAGLGFGYNLTNNISARTKFEYIDLSDGVGVYSAGLQYKF